MLHCLPLNFLGHPFYFYPIPFFSPAPPFFSPLTKAKKKEDSSLSLVNPPPDGERAFSDGGVRGEL